MVADPRNSAAPLVLGLAFIAIGASRHRALVVIGMTMLVFSILRGLRSRRP